MSGHKRATVTISQEEYRRLYEAERRNEYSAVELPLVNYQAVNQKSNDELLYEVNNLSQRQEKYLNSINHLNDKIKDIEFAASKTLVEQQVDFYNQLAQNSSEIWRNAEDYIEVQSRELNQKVIAQHEQLQKQIIQLENRIIRQTKEKQAGYEAAIEWINNSLAIHDFIQGEYHLNEQNFIEFSNLENQLEIAISNLQNHFFEASISTAQQAFTSLTKFRLKLEKELSERTELILAMNNQCQVLLDKIALNQTCHAIDIHGNILDERLIVDEWVNGKLSVLGAEINELLKYINLPDSTFQIDEIREFLQNRIKGKNDEIDDLIMDARYYALNSQLRFTIAQQMMLSLVEQGFRPVSGGFISNNYNGQYVAKAINHDGGEVTITINPDEYIPLKNEIHIQSKDSATLTEHELIQRSNEIRKSLVNNGLEVSQPIEVGVQNYPSNQSALHRKESRKFVKSDR